MADLVGMNWNGDDRAANRTGLKKHGLSVVSNNILVTLVNNGLADKTSTEPGLGYRRVAQRDAGKNPGCVCDFGPGLVICELRHGEPVKCELKVRSAGVNRWCNAN